MKRILLVLLWLLTSQTALLNGQVLDSLSFNSIKLRSVGPAFMTGRISDVIINPKDESHWYVGVGSGGVWESKNAGITFKPIFDKQTVYSIGCLALDTSNGNLWVGTGENVGGRHISFGDGIYLSENGGKTWKNMGLSESFHISKIVIHPRNSNILWVASQGPLWNKGGQRGIFKTVDGGKSWKQVLGDNEWMGATDLLIDPRNPSILYAATWQRHRTVAAYLGGGPKSGIYKSIDGGETWIKLNSGLPNGNLGKIGLAMSYQKPDVVYAAIELELKKGGFYRTEDGGKSWVKKSDIISGGTGPHYYQEIWACPHQFDRVYFANNYFKVTQDGGKTFTQVGKKYKHVDNHAMAFKMSDPDYLMVGTDGGLYESFDLSKTWRHMGNLPITQFYKLALDDAFPFYNIYGGTQDNNTQGGKSRTVNLSGISNADWKVVLGGDGHQPATEPGNPNIVYCQSQQGWYSRVDMATGEIVGIRPQPGANEGHERYNWDAPILVSHHDSSRVYVASQRLWRSDNRGDGWEAISPDLTRNEDRITLPIMGRKQSYQNPWDFYAMSTYNTITSIAESPLNEQVLYVGTDDGLFQSTKDGGNTWSKLDIKNIKGVPERAYINDIKADLFDVNKVYLLIDAHKQGNFKPFVLVSSDGGKSWKDMSGNLPDKHYAWRIVQDHVNPKLFFLGTEFGLFFTLDEGVNWVQLKGGLPTISFRDLAIQRRENDLVAASFGRSFYILDDYSFLRELNAEALSSDATLFSLRDAYLFRLRRDGRQKSGSLGGQHFYGSNPAHGATFTYYIKESYTTKLEARKKNESQLNQSNENIPFPGWQEMVNEKYDRSPSYWLIIKDISGNILRRLKLSNTKGIHRITWDMKASSGYPVGPNDKMDNKSGLWYVSSGIYYAQIYREEDGKFVRLDEQQEFSLKPLERSSLPEKSVKEKKEYAQAYMNAQIRRSKMNLRFSKLEKNLKALRVSEQRINSTFSDELSAIMALQKKADSLKISLYGNPFKNAIGEKVNPTLGDRLNAAGSSLWASNYGPTETAIQSLKIANSLMSEYEKWLDALEAEMKRIYAAIRSQGAPPILELE